MKRNVARTAVKIAKVLTLTAIMVFGWLGFLGVYTYGGQKSLTPITTNTPIIIATPASTGDNIIVTIDGVPVIFAEQQPVIVDNRTLVPIREVFEALGFNVEWRQDRQAAVLSNSEVILNIPIGTYWFTARNQGSTGLLEAGNHTIALDVPAQLINDRTMLPIRLPLEAAGYELEWDSVNRIVAITLSSNYIISTPTTEQTTSPQPTTPTQTTEETEEENQANQATQSLPTVCATRSNITLPNRQLTQSEIEAWSTEWHELGGVNDFEAELARLINEVRVSYGLQPLTICPSLSMAARYHSQDMAQHGFFGHISPNTGGAWSRAMMFATTLNSEVITGRNSIANASLTVDAWLNSPSHRESMLREGHVFIGIGVAYAGLAFSGDGAGIPVVKFG